MRIVGRLADLTTADIDAGLERRQDRQLARYEREIDEDSDEDGRLEYLDQLDHRQEAA